MTSKKIIYVTFVNPGSSLDRQDRGLSPIQTQTHHLGDPLCNIDESDHKLPTLTGINACSYIKVLIDIKVRGYIYVAIGTDSEAPIPAGPNTRCQRWRGGRYIWGTMSIKDRVREVNLSS